MAASGTVYARVCSSVCLVSSSRIDGGSVGFRHTMCQNWRIRYTPETYVEIGEYTYEMLWNPETRLSRQDSTTACTAFHNGIRGKLVRGVKSKVTTGRRRLVIAS